MRTLGSAIALAVVASACDCGTPAKPIWIGVSGAPRVVAVSEAGDGVATVAEPPSLEGGVRALLARADGTILVLEEVDLGAPPAVLVDRSGARVAAFASADGSGAPLFDAENPPWAAASAPDGTIWVTGGLAPVRYAADGTFAGRAAPLPNATRGVAALPDGRMIVGYGLMGVALYLADGTLASTSTASLGPPDTYYGIDALAVRGTAILVSVLRHGIATEGIVMEASLAGGSLVPAGDPGASARLPWSASALVVDGDHVLAGPALAALAPPSCAIRLSSSLRASEGCVTGGAHRGVAVVR